MTKPATLGSRLLLVACLALIGSPSGLQSQAASVRSPGDASPPTAQAANALIGEYCTGCHSERMRRGDLVLASFDVDGAASDMTTAEKMVRKLRSGMMPPAGARRPDDASLAGLALALEDRLDAAAAAHPNPGERSFQRLNRAEYTRAIRDLLSLEIDAGAFLPLDTKSGNFDNNADAQLLSPTLMDAYLRAAGEISRLAVGDPGATPSETTFRVSRWASQVDRVEGAPFGTRGGTSVIHNFPADGDYQFRVSFHHETTGALFGSGPAAPHTASEPERIEISINGEPVALLELDRYMHVSDSNGVTLRTGPIPVKAGPQRITAAFVQRLEGSFQDLVSPHAWTIASTSIATAYGFTTFPHLRDFVVSGPFDVTGVSENPIRAGIFTCRPSGPSEELPCATEILSRLSERAYRRPVSDENVADLLSFYREGKAVGGFDEGIRNALEAILASPHFVFRLESVPEGIEAGVPYAISDLELASRLSFFLWSGPPDPALIEVAAAGRLSDPEELEAQVVRMLADPRSESLSSRFAAQWLRLQDLEKIHPDVRLYPDYHEQLALAMHRETVLFFTNLVDNDESVLDVLTADYTFLNERLAEHYGIPGVTGEAFRRVEMPDPDRRGILGHASILTLTSHANRTSPVLRGKWTMEVLLGTPPPPPPPNVPELEATTDAVEGRLLSVRERMEEHRASPACVSCHRMMDPIGLALEGFDVTGARRIKDNGVPIDPVGELYDGRTIEGPADLREALVDYQEAFLRTFTENLLTYALGRRLEPFDMPTVRSIVREARTEDHRISEYILGVVRSPAFRMSVIRAGDVSEGS